MTLFESLLLAHLAGDWLLQTEWQALNKDRDWRAMLTHVVFYHLLVLIVLMLWYGPENPYIYLVTVVLAITHAVLDRRRSVAWIMRTLRISVTRPPETWLTIVIDQTLHILLLGVAVWFLTNYATR